MDTLDRSTAETSAHSVSQPRAVSDLCDLIKDNDKTTEIYTGLSSWDMFLFVFSHLEAYIPKKGHPSQLSLKDEFLIVLMQLRLNLMPEDLAHRFQLSVSTVSRIFQDWINVMYIRLNFFIIWPTREIVKHSMPQVFKDTYPDCRCIIDCTEISIERPHLITARSQTYSRHMRHNTVKFLMGIAPSGAISYLSSCWGGMVTDKHLTQNCGILSLLEDGDTVLAEREFPISDDLEEHGARLDVPTLTKSGSQLTQQVLECSPSLSEVRINIERVVGHLKTRYTILKGVVPVSLVKQPNDRVCIIDKIVTVCAALTNLAPSIIAQ